MTIRLKLFGAYRQYTTQNPIELDIPTPASVSDVRSALLSYAQREWPNFPAALVDASAFATSTAVLREGEAITQNELAVLPPVSGG